MPYMAGSFRRGGLAGHMRSVFTVVNYADGENTLGAGGKKTRTVLYTGLRGRLNDLSSTEKKRDSRLELDTTHECICYSRGITLKPKYVFELNDSDRVFEVIGIKQYENVNDVFSLKLREYEVQERPQP